MKIALNFKTPDVINYALENVEVPCYRTLDMDDEEFDAEKDIWLLQLKEKIGRHIKYGECVTIYYNTETDKLELE